MVVEAAMAEKKKKSTRPANSAEIAWCGWRMLVPPDWRPLKITGEPGKGSMMIGDADQPLILVQWRRVADKDFDAAAWLSGRFKKLRTTPGAGAPQARGIQVSGWVKDLALREDDVKSVWYGFSRSAGLLLERPYKSGIKPW